MGIISAYKSLFDLVVSMGYFDWTQNEKKQIMDSLKALSPIERVRVRDIVKDMSASDALAHLAQELTRAQAIQAAVHPQDKAPESQNKPLKPSKAINTPMKANKGQNKPLKADISQNKPVKPSKGTKARAGAIKAVEKLAKPCEAVKGSIKPLETVKSPDEPLERVQGDISSPYYFNIDEIKERIRQAINEYLLIHDMEQSDMIKAPQRIFGALSDYIGEKVFKDTKILKMIPYDDKGAYITNNNAYDVNKMVDMLDFYFTLCKEYNKTFLYDYAAGFLGMPEQTLYNISDKLTSAGFELGKKREESLAAGIVDGKQSPVGALAALNHWHGWSGASTNRTEVRETTVVYPVLVDINKNKSDLISDNSNNNT